MAAQSTSLSFVLTIGVALLMMLVTGENQTWFDSFLLGMHPAIAALRGFEPPVSVLHSKCDFVSTAAVLAPALPTYLRVVQGPRHLQPRLVSLQKGLRSPTTALM